MPENKICKYCQREIEADSIFCRFCGQKAVRERKKKDEVKVPPPKINAHGEYWNRLMVRGQTATVKEATEAAYYIRARAVKTLLLDTVQELPKKSLSRAIDDYIDLKQAVLSPETIRGYRIVQKYRFPELMKKDVGKITETDLQRAVTAASAKLSPKTVKNSLGFVKGVLKKATGRSYDVELPAAVPAQKQYLDPDQIAVFCAAIKGSAVEIPALLALSSLRRSEIAGLQWSSVDLEHRRLMIDNVVVYDEHSKKVSKPNAKNRSSNRTVPIMMDQLADALQAVEQKDGSVVTCAPNTIYRRINRICEDNNLPLVGVHGLRHSFASLAASLKMPEPVAMAIGGWSNNQTMRKIYTHVFEQDKERYKNEMAAFYNG